MPLIAHVLANDTDSDGDVLAVTGLTNLPPAGATVTVVDGGNAVQVTPARTHGTDHLRLQHRRRPGADLDRPRQRRDPPVDARTPRPWSPPNEPAVDVDAGARITVDLLRDVTDPDGDALTLTSARLPAGAGSVETTAAGLAVVTPSNVGTVALSFTVSDGHGGTSQGVQTFNVSPQDTPIAPQTHDDHLQVAVGATGTVDVLANDISGSGQPLSLARVSTHRRPALTIRPSSAAACSG